MMLRRIGIIFLWTLAMPAAASDWCQSANPARLNPAEATICNYQHLRGLDAQMADAFFARRDASSGAERDRLIHEQYNSWRHYRDACGRNAACLNERISQRIVVLGGAATACTMGIGGGFTPPVSDADLLEAFRNAQYRTCLDQAPEQGCGPPPLNQRAQFEDINLLSVLELTEWANARSVDLETLFLRILSPASASYILQNSPGESTWERLNFQLLVLNGLDFP